MRFTKKELKKIIQEEYQKVLKEYVTEGQPELEPESWYGKKPEGVGAEFELGAFIIKLDKISREYEECSGKRLQPSLGKELDSILTGLNVANKQTPSQGLDEAEEQKAKKE